MRMIDQMVLHEGVHLNPVPTDRGTIIGIGYNLSVRGPAVLEDVLGHALGDGITQDEAVALLEADLARVARMLGVYAPAYATLDPIRQRVVMEIAFSLGADAGQFRAVVDAVTERDWSATAMAIHRTEWANDRRERLAKMMLTGTDFTS